MPKSRKKHIQPPAALVQCQTWQDEKTNRKHKVTFAVDEKYEYRYHPTRGWRRQTLRNAAISNKKRDELHPLAKAVQKVFFRKQMAGA